MRKMRMIGALLALAALVGCGKEDGPKLVRVTGTVTLNGQPLSGAHVTFLPTGETRGTGADAKTNEEGVFELKARHRGPGTVAGTYKVVISKMVKKDGSDIGPDDATPPILAGASEILPGTYSSHAGSTLKATVPEEGGDLRFELKVAKR